MSTKDFIKGELYRLGKTTGIWPTEVFVKARIYDELAAEFARNDEDGIMLEYRYGRLVSVFRDPFQVGGVDKKVGVGTADGD